MESTLENAGDVLHTAHNAGAGYYRHVFGYAIFPPPVKGNIIVAGIDGIIDNACCPINIICKLHDVNGSIKRVKLFVHQLSRSVSILLSRSSCRRRPAFSLSRLSFILRRPK